MRYAILTLTHLVVVVAGVFIGVQISQREPLPIAVQQVTEARLVAMPAEPVAPTELGLADIDAQETIFRKQFVAHQLAAVSDAAALRAILDSLLGRSDPVLSHVLANTFLERFIELDVESAVAYVENSRLPQDQKQLLLGNIVTTWVRHDPERAMDFYRKLHSQQVKNMIGARLLADPTLADTGMLSEVESELGAYANQINEQVRLRQLSPGTAFEEALQLSGMQRQQQLIGATARWFHADPDAVLQRLSEITDTKQRQNILRVISSIQAQQDIDAALATIRTYAPNDNRLEQQVLMTFAARQPEQAIPYVLDYADRTGQSQVLSSMVGNWVRTNPQAALAFAETIDTRHRQAVMQGLAYNYVATHPDEGMDWLLSLDSRDQQIRSMAISALPQADMTLAELWLDRIDDAQLATALLHQITNLKANADPAATYAWLEEHEDRADHPQALASVFRQWGQRDPEEAADLLNDHVDDDAFRHVFRTTASAWGSRDIDAAMDWLASMPDGTAKTSVAQALVPMVVRSDPDDALHLISLVPKSQAADLRMQVALQWLRQSRDETETIIRQLALSEAQAEQLRRSQQRDP